MAVSVMDADPSMFFPDGAEIVTVFNELSMRLRNRGMSGEIIVGSVTVTDPADASIR